jgi:class 3 adenylate cyclase
LAADVVWYSRLMGEDETGTLAALKALRAELVDPTISEFRGRIVTLMVVGGCGIWLREMIAVAAGVL